MQGKPAPKLGLSLGKFLASLRKGFKNQLVVEKKNGFIEATVLQLCDCPCRVRIPQRQCVCVAAQRLFSSYIYTYF